MNELYEIDDLKLPKEQKKRVLEWYARKLWHILRQLDISDGHCKMYDPLLFDTEKKVVHSYIFDLWDGGRHHPYETLKQVEDGITKEVITEIQSVMIGPVFGELTQKDIEAWKARIDPKYK